MVLAGDDSWLPPAAAPTWRVGRPGGPDVWCRYRFAPGTSAGRRWVTAPSGTRCLPCSPSCRSASRTRRASARHHAQMEGLKDSKQALAGEALTSMSGFAPPMLVGPGDAAGHPASPAQHQHGDHQCAGASDSPLRTGPSDDQAYPYVPLAGQVRIGVAIFSYNGRVNVGHDRGLRHHRRSRSTGAWNRGRHEPVGEEPVEVLSSPGRRSRNPNWQLTHEEQIGLKIPRGRVGGCLQRAR